MVKRISLLCVALLSVHLGEAAAVASENTDAVKNQIKFYIYTQETIEEPERIQPDVESIIRSPFNALKPTLLTIHRWRGSYLAWENIIGVRVKLAQEDCNVIVVDWKDVPFQNLAEAIRMSPLVAEAVEDLIKELSLQFDVPLSSIHLMGFDLGAHIAGLVGQMVVQDFNGTKVERLTALDPLKDAFVSSERKLGPEDANFVEVIHTNAGGLGVKEPLGHVDFYPNGGEKQPGCSPSDNLCHHERAYEYLPEMWSKKVNEFVSAKCGSTHNLSAKSCAWMDVKMGQMTHKRGIFFLETGYAYPYGRGSYLKEFY